MFTRRLGRPRFEGDPSSVVNPPPAAAPRAASNVLTWRDWINAALIVALAGVILGASLFIVGAP